MDTKIAFAVFSDIHANLPALQAVLEDIARHNVDQRYCLGDLVDFAPWPNEVIALLREQQIPVVCGNHDRRVSCHEPVTPLPWHSPEERDARARAIALSKRMLNTRNHHWLQTRPTSLQLQLPHPVRPRKIMLVHASPRSLSEYLHADISTEQLLEYRQTYDFDVLICGHTHHAHIRTMDDMVVANTGAVGRIKPGQPNATWLLCEYDSGKFTIAVKAVQYDVTAVAQAIRESDVPDFYADELLSRC